MRQPRAAGLGQESIPEAVRAGELPWGWGRLLHLRASAELSPALLGTAGKNPGSLLAPS